MVTALAFITFHEEAQKLNSVDAVRLAQKLENIQGVPRDCFIDAWTVRKILQELQK